MSLRAASGPVTCSLQLTAYLLFLTGARHWQSGRDVAIEAGDSTGQPALLASGLRPRLLKDGLVFFAVMAVYFATAMASMSLTAAPENVVAVWPAAGIAVGALLMLGPRARWPVGFAVFAANVVAGLYQGKPNASVLTFAAANTLECLLIARLTERFAGAPFNINNFRRVLIFLCAALLGSAIAAVPAAVMVTLAGTTASPFIDVWSLWFRSDFIGIITVAPVFVGFGVAMTALPTRLEWAEGLLLLLLLVAAAIYLLSLPPQGGPWPSSVASSLLFPFMLAVAARCRPLFPAAGSALIALVVIVTANLGIGRFGAGDFSLADRILQAQVAMAGIALCSLSLAALFARGHEAEDALRESEEKLRVSLAAGRLGHWELDLARREVTGSDISYAVFGGVPRPRLTYAEVVSAVHRDDRARFEAAVENAIERSNVIDLECRAFWPDRTVHWVHLVGRVDRDRRGKPVKINGTSRDITQRKEVESALRDSEKQQRLALDAAHIGTWRHDIATGKVTFDVRADQHVGLGPVADWRRFVDLLQADNHLAGRNALSPPVDPAIDVEQSFGAFRVCRHDGTWHWLRIGTVVAFEGTGTNRRVVSMVGTTQDETERIQSEEQQKLLVLELDHRVKNMLTVIEVLIDRSLENAQSPDALAASIRARIGAMGRVHDKLSRSKWSGVDLKTIVDEELAPFRTPYNLTLAGPAVLLSPAAALALSMTVHELATNAAKHGSLSRAGGLVSISWDIEPDCRENGILRIRWQEDKGPTISSVPQRLGFGTSIIRGLISHELGGTVDFTLEPSGVRCELRVAASKVLADSAVIRPD